MKAMIPSLASRSCANLVEEMYEKEEQDEQKTDTEPEPGSIEEKIVAKIEKDPGYEAVNRYTIYIYIYTIYIYIYI